MNTQNQIIISGVVILITLIGLWLVPSYIKQERRNTMLNQCARDGKTYRLCTCFYEATFTVSSRNELKGLIKEAAFKRSLFSDKTIESILNQCSGELKAEYQEDFMSSCRASDPRLNAYCACGYDETFATIDTQDILGLLSVPQTARAQVLSLARPNMKECEGRIPLSYREQKRKVFGE